MNSILGSAPIVDFDGTIAFLPVVWDRLRAQLGVRRISDLWSEDDVDSWALVRAAEEEAAQRALPNRRLLHVLENVEAAAVLTSNSKACVSVFLSRYPLLESRVGVIVGREELCGPKEDFDVFRRGFFQCVSATASARGKEPVVYVGDAEYELRYARALGARTWNVKEL